MEIVVPQDGANVASVPGVIFWRPYLIGDYKYFGLVLDRRQSLVR